MKRLNKRFTEVVFQLEREKVFKKSFVEREFTLTNCQKNSLIVKIFLTSERFFAFSCYIELLLVVFQVLF